MQSRYLQSITFVWYAQAFLKTGLMLPGSPIATHSIDKSTLFATERKSIMLRQDSHKLKKLRRSGNPLLAAKNLESEKFGSETSRSEGGANCMTLQGTVYKTMFLSSLVGASAIFTWQKAFSLGLDARSDMAPWVIGSSMIGFIIALCIIWTKDLAPALSPFYAIFEGMCIGSVSAFVEQRYPGIVMPCVGLTFATLASMLAAYCTGLIKPTQSFRLGIFSATCGIAILYAVDALMSMFLHAPMPFLHQGGWSALAVSIVIVCVAALNLVCDFGNISEAVQAKMPKYMEWYGAFGLIVSLVWLYLEILRMMGKSNSNR